MKHSLPLFLSFSLLLASPVSAATWCTSPTDQAAFDVGALKSELSILAIACGNQDNYNQFVERYRSELVSQDKVVNNWFAHTYGRNARTRYDSYITLLANEQSNRGQHEGSDFCPRLRVMFSEAMAVPELKLLAEYAAGKALIPPEMGSCEGETAVAAKPETHRPTARRQQAHAG